MIPQSNCKLAGVARGGTSEDYATAGVDGANVLGRAGVAAYLYQRRASLQQAQARNVETVSYLLVDPIVSFATGDVLTIVQRGVTIKRTVQSIRNSQTHGLPPQPVRLELEES